MRAIDGDRLKRKAQKVATEAWKMKIKASVETILNEFMDWIDDSPTIEPVDIFTMLSDEEKQQNKWWGQGYIDALAERKKGKWIKHIDDLFPAESTIECSECHHEQPLTIDSNFCPNCGAEMEGQDDGI